MEAPQTIIGQSDQGYDQYRIAFEDQRPCWFFGFQIGSKNIRNEDLSSEDSPAPSLEGCKSFDTQGMTIHRDAKGFDNYQEMMDYIFNNEFILPE